VNLFTERSGGDARCFPSIEVNPGCCCLGDSWSNVAVLTAPLCVLDATASLLPDADRLFIQVVDSEGGVRVELAEMGLVGRCGDGCARFPTLPGSKDSTFKAGVKLLQERSSGGSFGELLVVSRRRDRAVQVRVSRELVVQDCGELNRSTAGAFARIAL
jgi:hypothetical protein